MKKTFKFVAHRVPVVAFAILCVAWNAQGQAGRDARLISARAGGVNHVAGGVGVKSQGAAAWTTLTTEQNLDSGDVVRTGADGRVEVLLNPGSYLRIGENAEFELADASLDNLRVKLLKGSAVVEATGYGDVPLLIAVDTPHTQVSIIRSGIYRINVLPGASDVAVYKGRALVGASQATFVKGGQTARVSGDRRSSGGVGVAKLDKKSRDALDMWSKERAGELASANRKLSARTLNPMLASLSFNNLWAGGSTSARYFQLGFWIFNARTGCYTFLPFYDNWSSPYGGYYGSRMDGLANFNNCFGCQHNTYGTSPGIASGGTSTTTSPSPAGMGTSPAPAPTMRQIQPSMRDIESHAVENQRVVGPSVTRPREQ